MTTNRYRVEKPDDTMGRPQPLDDAVRIVTARMQRMPDGDVLRVRKITYELPPENPPNFDDNYTVSALQGYRRAVARFPKIGWAGGLVCKKTDSGAVSQHAVRTVKLPSAGNAIDWTAPDHVEQDGADALIKWLWTFTRWAIKETEAGRRSTAELIFRDQKWTPARGWFKYTGTFHWSHVHESFAPMSNTSAECVGP